VIFSGDSSFVLNANGKRFTFKSDKKKLSGERMKKTDDLELLIERALSTELTPKRTKATKLLSSLPNGLKTFVYNQINYKFLPRWRRRKLRNKNFTVFCNNCRAGKWAYNELGLRYTTPTVGLFFLSNDYIKFLENFEYYIKQPLWFKRTSKSEKVNEYRKTKPYPVGALDDVEIHFMHYKSESETAEKWTRRTQRINFSNLFFMYVGPPSGRIDNLNVNTVQDAKRFEDLPFVHKILVPEPDASPRTANVVLMSGGSIEVKPFNMVKWLNGEYDACER